MPGWPNRGGARQITPLDRLACAPPTGRCDARVCSAGARRHRPDPLRSASRRFGGRSPAHRPGQFGNDDGARSALQQLIHVGTSAGGARAKAVVAFNPATFQVRSAYEHFADGFEQWLIKLDGVSGTGMDGHSDRLGEAPYGRVEFAYYLMATAAGIGMSPCRLLDEGPRRHFMTKRFDRGPRGERVHIVSLCALAHLDYNMIATHSYDQFLLAVAEPGLENGALTQAFRRMVFNVMAVNNDDHTKNFAFLLHEGGRWALAPAYDVTHAYRPDSAWTAQHHHGREGRGHRPALDRPDAAVEPGGGVFDTVGPAARRGGPPLDRRPLDRLVRGVHGPHLAPNACRDWSFRPRPRRCPAALWVHELVGAEVRRAWRFGRPGSGGRGEPGERPVGARVEAPHSAELRDGTRLLAAGTVDVDIPEGLLEL